MSKAAEMLAEFHKAFAHPDTDALWLRPTLHQEEHAELIEALESGDREAIARELADVLYIAYGTAHVYGIDLDVALQEVHRANMSKLAPCPRDCGKFIEAGDVTVGTVLEFKIVYDDDDYDYSPRTVADRKDAGDGTVTLTLEQRNGERYEWIAPYEKRVHVSRDHCPVCEGIGGVCVRRDDGKVLKGPNFTPPIVSLALRKAA